MFKTMLVEDNTAYRQDVPDSLRTPIFWISMDIGLPDGSGLELTKRIKIKRPQACVAMLTSLGGPEYCEAAVRLRGKPFPDQGGRNRRGNPLLGQICSV